MIRWQRRALGFLLLWPLLVLLAFVVKHWTAAPWLSLIEALWGWNVY